MPFRIVVAKELADFLGAIAHPARVRLIEELRDDERDVSSLSAASELSQSSTSQHLMVLRAHRVVVERREGRHVLYRLKQPKLAEWLAEAVDLLPESASEIDDVRQAIRKVRSVWKPAKNTKNKSSSHSPGNGRSD